jgi:hypothetical protein
MMLSLFIIIFVIYVVAFFKIDAKGVVNSPLAAIICILFVGFYYSYSIILIIKNTIRIQKDMPVKYKPYFKIIK